MAHRKELEMNNLEVQTKNWAKNIRLQAKNANTERSRNNWVKICHTLGASCGQAEKIKEFEPVKLNKILKTFYAEVSLALVGIKEVGGQSLPPLDFLGLNFFVP